MSTLYYTAWPQRACVALDVSAERCGDEHMRRYSLWICNDVPILPYIHHKHIPLLVQIAYLVLALDVFEYSVCRCSRLTRLKCTSPAPGWSWRRGLQKCGFQFFPHPSEIRNCAYTQAILVALRARFSSWRKLVFVTAPADASAAELCARVALRSAMQVS